MNDPICWDPSLVKKFSSSNHYKLLNQLRNEVKKYPLNNKNKTSSIQVKNNNLDYKNKLNVSNVKNNSSELLPLEKNNFIKLSIGKKKHYKIII